MNKEKKRFKRRRQFLIFCLLLLLTAIGTGSLPVSVKAADAANTDGFVIEDGVLTKYTGVNTIVTIPDGVKRISASAFVDKKKSIEKIIMPDSVRYIDADAFNGCTGLASVSFSYRLKYLGARAFKGCTNLQFVDLSATKLELIDKNTFDGCKRLTEVILPESIKVIGDKGFFECKRLGSINLPEGLTSIQEYAFTDCYSLSTVELPDTLTYIGVEAFNRCISLGSIRIPAGVTNLQAYTFNGCYWLSEVYLPDTMQTIQTGALHASNSLDGLRGCLTKVYLPESVEYIGKGGLSKDAGIELIQGKAGSYADSYAAYLDTTRDDVENKAGVNWHVAFETVKDNAVITFDACGGKLSEADSSKTGIIGQMYGALPTPVLKGYAFCGWYQDKGLKKRAKTTTLIAEENTTLYAKWEKEKAVKEVYAGKSSDFTITNGKLTRYTGLETTVIVPEGVTELGVEVFRDKTFITRIILPESLKNLGKNTFYGCSNLVEINIPKGVTVIPDSTFYQCTALQSIVIPEGVTEIGELAFEQAYALSSVILPEGLISIGPGAFEYCTKLMELKLPTSLQSIGKNAFCNCTSLRRICIPAGVETFSEGVFSGAESLEEIRLENGLKTIGKGIIRNNRVLENLYIPETVTNIDNKALEETHLASLTIVGVESGVAYNYYKSLEILPLMYKNDKGEAHPVALTFSPITLNATISFDTKVEGMTLEDKKAAVNQTYGVLPVISQEGKTFAGWSLTGDMAGLVKETDVIEKEETKLIAVWTDIVEQGDEEPEETPIIPVPDEVEVDDKITEIHTAEDLSKIRENLHGNYKLMKDIDLTDATKVGGTLDSDGYGFLPIGTVVTETDGEKKYTEEAFIGVLDGNGHTIKGLTIRGDTPYSGTGLFARIEGGVVKNLTLEDVNIEVGSTSVRTGALAGAIDINDNTQEKAVISNITVTGEVKVTTDGNEEKFVTQNIAIGGVIGYVGKASVSNVKNQADVTYWSNKQEKPKASCSRFLGGVAGYLNGGTIYQSSNTGAVSGYRSFYGVFDNANEGDVVQKALAGTDDYVTAGGILGNAAANGKIEQCYNTGAVGARIVNQRPLFNLNISSYCDVMVGGIVGVLYKNTAVVDCYNTGTLGGSSEATTTLLPDPENADGFWGLLDANTVSAPLNAEAYTAGIVGYSTIYASGPVKNCYNTGSLSGGEDCVYGIANGDVPVVYSRYAAMSMTKKLEDGTEKNITLTGTENSESISTCQSIALKDLGMKKSYSGFDFDSTWFLIENSNMMGPMLYGNMEGEVESVNFVEDEEHPIKTEYAFGEPLDLTGLHIEVKLTNMEEPITVDITGGRNTGYNPYKQGEQKLTLSYFGETYELTVTVGAETYELIVNNGTGSGVYTEGTKVEIQATDLTETEHMRFQKWVIESGKAEIEDAESETTTVTIGSEDVEIVAVYDAQTPIYRVVVENGTGSGYYSEGETVTIAANEPEEGMVFSHWIITSSVDTTTDSIELPSLKDEKSVTTTFVMTNTGLIVTAVYVEEGEEDTPGGQTPGGQTPGGDDTPGGQTPGGQTPGGQTPGGEETPGDQTPGGQTPGGQTPGDQTPGGQTPGGDVTTGGNQTPTTETSTDSTKEPSAGTVLKDEKTGAGYKVLTETSKGGTVEYKAPANKNVKTVSIPNTVTIDGASYKVTSIAKNAFKGNKKLNKVTIGSNIETIGDSAFINCPSLKTVTIGKNVKKIGKKAFFGCSKLNKITIKSTVLKSVGKNAIKGINTKATIKCPKKQLAKYKKLFKSKTGYKNSMKIKK